MKITVFFLFAAVSVLCTACSTAGKSSAQTVDDTPWPQITYTDEWPDNQNTIGVPIPSAGSIAQVVSPSDGRYCSVTLEEVSENAVENYLINLEESGFFLLEDVSEDLSGDGDLSIGATYSNGKIGVSIAYYGGVFSLYMAVL